MAHLRKTEEQNGKAAVRNLRSSRAALRLVRGESVPEERGLRLEEVVGPVLRYGSLLSVGIILVGLALLVWKLRLTAGEPALLPAPESSSMLHGLSGLLAGIRSGDPSAVVGLGLMVLIATPVLRVASTVVYFFRQGDRTYLAITAFVFSVLVLGFFIGSAG